MSKQEFKRTKILATIGPATDSAEKILDLIMAGVNGCRLNFSHGNSAERDQQIEWIRAAAKQKGRSVALLQDLQGPKIRLGMLKDKKGLDVKTGDRLVLDYAIEEHDGGKKLPVQYNLAEKAKVGEPVFIFDGKIETEIVSIPSKTAIEVEVKNSGTIYSRKGLNLPETNFGGDVLTEKDMADIEFGCSRDFDYVALSFVHSAADVEKLRQVLVSHGSTAKIIAKIETKTAVASDESLEAIVKASDGVMVARGDMAVEVGAAVVPVVQKKLIALCRRYSKIVIVATQMMSSMTDNPEPTRAEVSDVANAVSQGADVVMLSDETANGQYPVETVKAMKKTILYTQNHSELEPIEDEITSLSPVYDALAQSTVDLAERLNADLIISQTASGATSFALATQRPALPILSVTSNPRVANQLALVYANTSFVRPYTSTYGLDLARELKASGYIRPAEGKDKLLVVITSGTKKAPSNSNTIQIAEI